MFFVMFSCPTDVICCRIRVHVEEETVKIKGVRLANWSVDTKMLTVIFNPSKLSLSKIHKKLAGVGHDTEIEKAKDEIYKQLPACCHYRELDEIAEDRTKNALSVSSPDSLEPNKPVQKTTDEPVLISYAIRGVVLEADKKGSFNPLVGASVVG